MRKENKEEPENVVQDKYMGSVKVGSKGQIVIPKEARDMFNIKPGDTLLLLADLERGIAIQRLDFFNKMADEIFSGKYKPPEKENNEQLTQFANEVKKVSKMKEKDE
ncbi:MAG TPA: AbrB family transcriptional regulator [Firmicutes bacterium]|nr:AbrB family transcriptional regulator [Bacillota bacterium]HBK67051.1 AbrB family transcriptional regulator [Bacillota bacterium]